MKVQNPNYFSLDGMCLQMVKMITKKRNVARDMRQFFYIHKINNNEMYNKYIRLVEIFRQKI